MGEGLVEGHFVADITAIEIADNDELYRIKLQGSTSDEFASVIEDLVILEVGAAEVLGGDQDSAIGRYKIPFSNEKNGTVYPFLRAYCDVSGSISAGINFSAYLSK